MILQLQNLLLDAHDLDLPLRGHGGQIGSERPRGANLTEKTELVLFVFSMGALVGLLAGIALTWLYKPRKSKEENNAI